MSRCMSSQCVQNTINAEMERPLVAVGGGAGSNMSHSLTVLEEWLAGAGACASRLQVVSSSTPDAKFNLFQCF